MDKEIWKDIKGYEGWYQVSNFGKVKSLTRYVNHWRGGKMKVKGTVLKPFINKKGYAKVGLSKNKNYKQFKVHRLVAEAFIENPENKPETNHIDGDKLNNHVNNIEWCTRLENMQHASENGLMNGMSGSTNGMAKLTEKEVLQIRSIYSQGWASQYELADAYGVSQVSIKDLLKRRTWKHV